jgi:hypothetical protein
MVLWMKAKAWEPRAGMPREERAAMVKEEREVMERKERLLIPIMDSSTTIPCGMMTMTSAPHR